MYYSRSVTDFVVEYPSSPIGKFELSQQTQKFYFVLPTIGRNASSQSLSSLSLLPLLSLPLSHPSPLPPTRPPMSAEETSSSNRWRLAGVAAIILVGLLGASVAFQPRYRHADLVAIKSVHTGKYLALDSDGLLRASASSSSEASARFRLLRLDANVVKAISKSKPPKTHLAVAGKLGCACSGASDEHGFGRFCHNWESEWHQPWCYVDASCKHGVRSKRHSSRHLQVCKEEEGYLGPDGWLPEPGCHCTGMESIHGFGAYCKGWEFPGQTPWCYVNEECGGALGTTGARFMDCVANDSVEVSPPPPPPLRLVESHDGWGTPQGCPCSGWSNKHGYGAYCKARCGLWHTHCARSRRKLLRGGSSFPMHPLPTCPRCLSTH